MAQEVEETTRPWPTKTTIAKKKTSAYEEGFAWLRVCHETTVFIGSYVLVSSQWYGLLLREKDKFVRNHVAVGFVHQLKVKRSDIDICCTIGPKLGATINRNVFFAIRNDQRTNHPQEELIHV